MDDSERRLGDLESRVTAMQLDVNILRVGLQNINRTPAPTFGAGVAPPPTPAREGERFGAVVRRVRGPEPLHHERIRAALNPKEPPSCPPVSPERARKEARDDLAADLRLANLSATGNSPETFIPKGPAGSAKSATTAVCDATSTIPGSPANSGGVPRCEEVAEPLFRSGSGVVLLVGDMSATLRTADWAPIVVEKAREIVTDAIRADRERLLAEVERRLSRAGVDTQRLLTADSPVGDVLAAMRNECAL